MSLIFKNEREKLLLSTLLGYELRLKDSKSTNLKMFEVAQMVGYETPQYFSTVFKKYTGIYP